MSQCVIIRNADGTSVRPGLYQSLVRECLDAQLALGVIDVSFELTLGPEISVKAFDQKWLGRPVLFKVAADTEHIDDAILEVILRRLHTTPQAWWDDDDRQALEHIIGENAWTVA